MPTLATILQVIVALGLFNVWLLRARTATGYRGGQAQSLKAEFATYGLPDAAFYIVGGLKIAAGAALLVGIWVPALVVPAAAVVAVLMVGALAMHFKVNDEPMKFLPALLMLLMSLAIILLHPPPAP